MLKDKNIDTYIKVVIHMENESPPPGNLLSEALIQVLDRHIRETREKFPETAYEFSGLDYESEEDDDTSA
tara:strand:- start:24563 stop:24772 length:210 start_codon:yes stop_codon:yes gene_type:complete